MNSFNRFFCLCAVALLAGCGMSEKTKQDDFGKNDKEQVVACQGKYDPIPLLLTGFEPVGNPEALAPGLYEVVSTEFFVKEDQGANGSTMVHFREVYRGGAPSLSKICGKTTMVNQVSEYKLPGLALVTVPVVGTPQAPNTRVEQSYVVQHYRGDFTGSRLTASNVLTGGFSAIMTNFSDSRLYQTSATTFQLHGEVFIPTANGTETRRIRQRIQFTPYVAP